MIKTATEGYVLTKIPKDIFTEMEVVVTPTGKRDGNLAEFLVIYPRVATPKIWLSRNQIYA